MKMKSTICAMIALAFAAMASFDCSASRYRDKDEHRTLGQVTEDVVGGVGDAATDVVGGVVNAADDVVTGVVGDDRKERRHHWRDRHGNRHWRTRSGHHHWRDSNGRLHWGHE